MGLWYSLDGLNGKDGMDGMDGMNGIGWKGWDFEIVGIDEMMILLG